MRQTLSETKTTVTATLLVLLACLLLAACGSSNNSSTSTSATSASANTSANTNTNTGTSANTNTNTGTGTGTGTSTTNPTTPPTAEGRGRGTRFSALRECLAKNGVNLPQRKPGQKGGGLGGLLLGGGRQLPPGVSKTQLEAALKKCAGSFGGGLARRLNNPAYKTALTAFSACMRENGVNLPTPNTSGGGPVFKGVNQNSPQFKTALAKCSSKLRFAVPGGAGAPQGAPPVPGGGG